MLLGWHGRSPQGSPPSAPRLAALQPWLKWQPCTQARCLGVPFCVADLLQPPGRVGHSTLTHSESLPANGLTTACACFQLCSGGHRPALCTRSLPRAARTAPCAATASSTAPRGATSWAAVRHREPGGRERGQPVGTTDPPAPSPQCASHPTSPCSTSTPALRASGCRCAAAPGTTPSPERPAGSWDFRSNSPRISHPAWALGPCQPPGHCSGPPALAGCTFRCLFPPALCFCAGRLCAQHCSGRFSVPPRGLVCRAASKRQGRGSQCPARGDPHCLSPLPSQCIAD